MDFSLTDEQQADRGPGRTRSSATSSTHERLQALEARRRAALRPRAVGGARQGRPARHRPARGRTAARASASSRPCLVLEQVGRTVAPVPYLADRRARRAADRASSAPTRSRQALPARRRRRRAACSPRRSSRPAPTRCARRRPPAPTATAGVLDGAKTCVPAGAASPTACLVPGRDRRRRRRPVPRRPVRRRRQPASARTRTIGHARGPPRRSTACASAATPCSATRSAAPTVVAWIVERATAALCAIAIGVCERGAAHHRRVHEDPRAVRPAHRHVPGRRPARRRRLHRHRGRSASPRWQAAWRLAEGLPADRARSRSPSSGPPRAASASCTPRSTCTAASASTATTRCTATSSGPSSSSSPSAAPRRSCSSSGEILADEPV